MWPSIWPKERMAGSGLNPYSASGIFSAALSIQAVTCVCTILGGPLIVLRAGSCAMMLDVTTSGGIFSLSAAASAHACFAAQDQILRLRFAPLRISPAGAHPATRKARVGAPGLPLG